MAMDEPTTLKDELLDLAKRAGYRAADAFVSALAFDNIFGLGLPEWKVAVAAAASAGIKPIQVWLKGKAGRG